MKPDTETAMEILIEQVREAIPFDTPADRLCAGSCTGCPKKLLEYLDMELEEWEQKLTSGEKPDFGDINKLTKASRKIFTILQRNNLIED
ncbi:MAG: hypothetical protein OIF55_20990 [Amphritea sp.]|nr:hypothetical protein [Amphritea sp.]